MTRARMISARISLFAAATPRAARASRECTYPSDGRIPGQRFQDVCAPLHRYVMHHHEEHAPRLDIDAVGDGARRPRPVRRRGGATAAPAPHRVPVMLHRLDPGLGDVGHLVQRGRPEVLGLSQVSAARAVPLREVADRLVRVIVPGQVRPGRAWLLARPPLALLAALAVLRLLPPGQVIGRRGHR